MSSKIKVLFVCVENSCRSQMAEGFAKKLSKDILEPLSAGSKPSGKINETAILVMKEKGIDLNAQHSKGLSELSSTQWDYVITMGCGDACPFVPSKEKQDWSIPDPKNMPLEKFREIRDHIEFRVKDFIQQVQNDAD